MNAKSESNKIKIKKLNYGLQLPREPHLATELLELTEMHNNFNVLEISIKEYQT